MGVESMSPRTKLIVILLLTVCAPTLVVAQEAAEAPEITFATTELASGLYMLEGVGGFGGGNVGLLTGEDGVVLVDDTFPPLTGVLLAAVAEVAPGPVDFVVNTHVHGDHMGGNEQLAGLGATVVAHDNVRQRLVTEGISTGTSKIPAPAGSLPVLTFADAVTFHLNGQEAHVFHLERAHTDGDAVIHFRSADVIHAGDVFFNGLFPFIDLDSGGSLDGYIAAQKEILARAGDATRIIPGHGPLATPADLSASIAMLEAIRDRVRPLVAEGKSVEEVLAAAPAADYEAWSWGFIDTERMVRQVYRDIAGD
jgi:glyoxylase-like metal-dependent hydrolase (beta-lactamase superfamily II)